MKPKLIELFSGHGTVSEEFRKQGFETFQIDIRKRKGVCMPDLQADIMNVFPDQIFDLFGQPDAVWFSFPCETMSNLAGNQHYENNLPVSEKAYQHLALLEHTLELVRQLNPILFFGENPRGRLRKNRMFRAWLDQHNGVVKELTYSSYGADTIKPTNIFTNAADWTARPLDRYGRGAKNPGGVSLLEKSTCQRQAIPRELAADIAKYSKEKLSEKGLQRIQVLQTPHELQFHY